MKEEGVPGITGIIYLHIHILWVRRKIDSGLAYACLPHPVVLKDRHLRGSSAFLHDSQKKCLRRHLQAHVDGSPGFELSWSVLLAEDGICEKVQVTGLLTTYIGLIQYIVWFPTLCLDRY